MASDLSSASRPCKPCESKGDLNEKTLMEVLFPIRNKWKFIGIALEFSLSELKCIDDQHRRFEHALLELVDKWLTGSELPSWERLVVALRSPTVDEPQLAGEIERKYCKFNFPFGDLAMAGELPEYPMTLPLAHYQQAPPKVLTLQPLPAGVMTRKETGAVISEGFEMTAIAHSLVDTKRPLYSRDLQLKDPTPYIESHVYKKHAEVLRECYSRTHDNKWPKGTLDRYFNLAIVHKKSRKANEFTRKTLHLGIDEILAEKEPLKMEDILKPLKGKPKVHCVLVEGPPGVGKSTFMWELCQRWDKIPDLKKFSLVVLLRFREKHVQEAKDIADLFYHDNASVQQAVATEVCDRSGEGVLLIFDGFDELPAHLRKRSLLLDIMKGKRLPKCTVVVTSRPSATADLFSSCKVDKHIEVLGFTQKEIDEYTSTIFDSEPQLLDDFHKYRKINPAIRSMMYIPLNTAIVADVFLSTGEPLSHTVTDLYVQMGLVVLMRYLKEFGCEEIADNLPYSFEDLPPEILSHFVKLGKMAFEGVVDEQVIFSKLPADTKHYGFLNASQGLFMRSTMSYHFLHRSFQDLFAAFYISQLPPSEQKEMFHKYYKKRKHYYEDDDRFETVWKFLAGLTSFKDIGWDVVKSQASIEQLVTYLYEVQDVTTCESVLENQHDQFSPTCLLDCHAVGWCMAVSECKLKLSFMYIRASRAEMFEAFSGGLKTQRNIRGSITNVRMQGNPHTDESILHLLDFPAEIWQETTEAFLDIDNSATEKLQDLFVHMVSLTDIIVAIGRKRVENRSFDIVRYYVPDYSKEDETSLVRLFHSLTQLRCLEKLTLRLECIGSAPVKELAKLICPATGHVKSLSIDIETRPSMSLQSDTGMSLECYQLLIGTLFSPSSLESIDMVHCEVSSNYMYDWDSVLSSMRDFFERLADNQNLTSITCFRIGRCERSLLEAMQRNASVKTFCLISFVIDYLPDLVAMLTANKHLQVLNVGVPDYSYYVRCKMCVDVIDALQHNQTLKTLEFIVHKEQLLFTPAELHNMDSRVVFRERS